MHRNSGGEPDGKIGFTVPEKVIGKAAQRNRIRRMLREAARLWWPFIRTGTDIIFIVNSMPKLVHGRYVEKIAMELFVKSDVLTASGLVRYEKRIAEIQSALGETE